LWLKSSCLIKVLPKAGDVDIRIVACEHNPGTINTISGYDEDHNYRCNSTWQGFELVISFVSEVDILPVDINTLDLGVSRVST